MKAITGHLTTSAKYVLSSWITWVAIGAVGGTGVLFSTGLVVSESDQGAAPSGSEIEAAVAQAEAAAKAARLAGATD